VLIININDLNNLVSRYYGNIGTSQDINNIFIDPANDNYHLTAGSDAIEARFNTQGSYWGIIIEDYDGEDRPKGAAYDIGFDEY